VVDRLFPGNTLLTLKAFSSGSGNAAWYQLLKVRYGLLVSVAPRHPVCPVLTISDENEYNIHIPGKAVPFGMFGGY